MWPQAAVQMNPIKCPRIECFNSLKNATLDILHTEINFSKAKNQVKTIEFKIYKKKSRSCELVVWFRDNGASLFTATVIVPAAL